MIANDSNRIQTIAKIANAIFAIPPPSAALRRNSPQIAARYVTERYGTLRFVATRSQSHPFGGETKKARKPNGFLKKPNNPRLYDNVTITNVNVTITNVNVTITFAEIPKMQAENEKMSAFIPFMLTISEKMQTELL